MAVGRLGTRSDIAVFLVFRMLSLEELIRRAETQVGLSDASLLRDLYRFVQEIQTILRAGRFPGKRPGVQPAGQASHERVGVRQGGRTQATQIDRYGFECQKVWPRLFSKAIHALDNHMIRIIRKISATRITPKLNRRIRRS